MPPPKPREKPKEWSLEKAKADGAQVKDFDPNPPSFDRTPRQQGRGQDGKFVPGSAKKGKGK